MTSRVQPGRAQLAKVQDAAFARWYAPSMLAIGLCLTLQATSVRAEDQALATETIVRQGRFVPTDELVGAKALPKVKTRRVATRRTTATTETSDAGWLFDYIGRLLDKEPEAAKRVRPAGRALAQRTAKPALPPAQKVATATAPVAGPVAVLPPQPTMPSLVPRANAKPIDADVVAVPMAPIAPAAPVMPPQQQPQPVAPVAVPASPVTIEAAKPAAKANDIITGGLASLPMARPNVPAAPVVTPDASQALVQAAERAQARSDLVKLELANRTYDEPRLSGQAAFDLRSDWRVLERARDALSGPELAAAQAAGFEANAYINEMTRTIVVAVAGSQDLRRDFLQADIWDALIRSQMPQQFFLAKTYIRSVMQRYQMRGFTTECVGHSLGGGACAYAAAELNVRAVVVNPIAAGKLPAGAKFLVTNYVVDGEIANLVYGARGHEFTGDVYRVSDGSREDARTKAVEKFGPAGGTNSRGARTVRQREGPQDRASARPHRATRGHGTAALVSSAFAGAWIQIPGAWPGNVGPTSRAGRLAARASARGCR